MKRNAPLAIALALFLPALAAARPEPGAVLSRARRMAGLRLLREEAQGSLVAVLKASELAGPRSAGRSSATRRAVPWLDRYLAGAVAAATTEPGRALHIVSAIERRAAQAKQKLPRGTTAALDEIRAVARRFGNDPLPSLGPKDRFLAAQLPDAKHVDVARAHEYAHQYVELQRQYNGASPSGTLARHPDFARWVKGEVPYWDVDPKTRRLETLGLVSAGPFRRPDGKVRIFSHYLGEMSQAVLRAFGQPTGKVPAEMTSSYRTLMLFPPGELPYMLKFSGELWEHSPTKKLTAQHVRISVERSLHLRRELSLVPEPAGLVLATANLNLEPVTAIYRPLPLPPRGRLRPGDALLAAHVAMSPEFAKTELGQKIFAARGSQLAWFQKELAPRIARIVFRSLRTNFAHLELHSQNVDVLVGADGKVRQVFVKDLLDMMHDPAAKASRRGKPPHGTAVLRDREWGDMGDARGFRTKNPQEFYFTYLGQLEFPLGNRTRSPKQPSGFQEAVRDELLALCSRRLDLRRLQRYPEYARITDHNSHDGIGPRLHEFIGDLRELLVKSDIDAHFRPDPTARTALLSSRGQLNTATSANRVDVDIEDPAAQQGQYPLVFGYVGKVPVAIRRADDLVAEYYFRFD